MAEVIIKSNGNKVSIIIDGKEIKDVERFGVRLNGSLVDVSIRVDKLDYSYEGLSKEE